ncbi:MAG TPA: transglycosylase domain-containing protein [Nitrospirota bacterium]|nr:transglycosylase domain-containing protein [Nitrospirota bacterium]
MKKIFLAAILAFAAIVLTILLWIFAALRNLPDVSALKRYRPAAAAEVLDRDGGFLAHCYDRKLRIWTPIAAIPKVVIQAVVIAEDDTFFGHHGVNYQATWDALVVDVQRKKFSRGGSTITQQMIKNVFLSKEKTLTRKVREFVLARKAEEILSKRRILEIYLNEVEWGDDIYGIEAASRYYFDKIPSELTAGEAALLAGMLPNPHYYEPFKRPEKARRRQKQVLFNMRQARLLTEEEYRSALDAPVVLRQEGSGRFDFSALKTGSGKACYQQALEQTLLALYGEQALYRGGLRIRTTLDRMLQDDLRRWEESSRDRSLDPPEKVVVVKKDNTIRAIVCGAGREEEVRSKLATPGLMVSIYDTAVVSPDTIEREQIILPEPHREKSGER